MLQDQQSLIALPRRKEAARWGQKGMITLSLWGNGDASLQEAIYMYDHVWPYLMWVIKSLKIQNLHCDPAICDMGRFINSINSGFIGPSLVVNKHG